MEPSVAHLIEMLQERSETDDATFLGAVSNFFTTARFPDSRPEIGADYERCCQHGTPSLDAHDAARCGAFEFYLFCTLAERWGRTHDDADRARADELLGDKRVRSFLFDLYGIEEEFRETRLALHASGTTSFIIKTHYLHNKYLRVIKIIKPWYLSDPVIAAQTKDSQEFYDRRLSHVTYLDRPIAPIVEYANRHCIIMEFVEGETLHQFFAHLWAQPDGEGAGPGEDPYAALNRVMLSLCGMMKECHQASIAHGDLSSTNILVEQMDTDLPRLRLIDFGINYLLTRNLEHIDHAPALIATVDPDVLRRKRDAVPTVESDMYSLGVILTEGFLGEHYRVDGMQVLLDEVYDRHPGVGALLDDLLDPNPSRRLPDVPGGVDPYDYIADRIDRELRTVSSFANAESNGRFTFLDDLLGFIFPGLPDIVKMIARRIRGGSTPPSVLVPKSRPRLERPMRDDLVVPISLNILTVSVVLARLIPWDAIFQGDAQFADSLSDSWPAWVVALACSIIASRYFVSIFAGLTTTGLPRSLVLSTILCAFAPWIPLMLILSRYPDEWLFLVAVGGTVVVANNWLWHRFCRSARRAIEELGIHASPLMHDTQFWLRGWTETSVITLVCVYAVAILAARDVLHDVTFYALIIAGVICPRVFFANLRTDAPRIRTGLQRFSNGYRRARVAPDSEGQRVPRLRSRNV
jgi:serine/threonine protein kinase